MRLAAAVALPGPCCGNSHNAIVALPVPCCGQGSCCAAIFCKRAYAEKAWAVQSTAQAWYAPTVPCRVHPSPPGWDNMFQGCLNAEIAKLMIAHQCQGGSNDACTTEDNKAGHCSGGLCKVEPTCAVSRTLQPGIQAQRATIDRLLLSHKADQHLHGIAGRQLSSRD